MSHFCPVQDHTDKIENLSADLLSELRQLRILILDCDTCAYRENCPHLKRLQNVVQGALEDLAAEWNLTPITTLQPC